MNIKNKILLVIVALTCVTNASSDKNIQKQAIKANGELIYGEKRVDVDNFLDMLTEGNIYGRLRNNNFYFAYDHHDETHNSHWVSGFGSSAIYKSARFSGFDVNVGFYGSLAIFNNDDLVKGANKTGVYKNSFIQTSVLYIDGDEAKSTAEDSMFYYFAIVKNLESLPAFQYRLRLGYRDFIGDTSVVSNYLDSRLEFNYLF
jgi:hypothetical protein